MLECLVIFRSQKLWSELPGQFFKKKIFYMIANVIKSQETNKYHFLFLRKITHGTLAVKRCWGFKPHFLATENYTRAV